jgi:cellulose synthase/poly-beta-1,6-N-acetylglucosamine synthase-like glycosyltransferase
MGWGLDFARDNAAAALLLLSVLSVFSAVLTIWAVRGVHDVREPSWACGPLVLALALFSALAAGAATGLWAGAAATAGAVLLVAGLMGRALPRLTAAGILMMTVAGLSVPVTGAWMWWLLADLGFPGWARGLFAAGVMFGLGPMVMRTAALLVHDAALTHRDWMRPHAALPVRRTGGFVSVHVPCHAEPPALVMATLDALAAQDYADFEVLVCDNNTADEALWRPVQAHCAWLNRRLGTARFRFFHVSPIAGAKAGALNYLLKQMAPQTAMVAVVDADYLAEPQFLSRLVGHFDDPAIAYVQTPHDYRDFADSAYLRGCYWEYMPANRVSFPGLNEYGCAVTIGTMCLLRADALVRAGGWAEWCLSEDSELSVRLRGLGYRGVYVKETFGRGLIPGTFLDYKKQRFRWMAGPVQQVVRHWRMLLPRALGGVLGGVGEMNGWSKLLEVERSMGPVMLAASTVVGTGLGVVAGLLTIQGALPVFVLPEIGWWALGLATLASVINGTTRLRLAGCVRPGDMARAAFARMALSWVTMVAGLAGLTGRELAWRRTPKFSAKRSGLAALRTVWAETLLGLGFFGLTMAMAALSGPLGRDLALLTAASAFLASMRFLAAPVMALMSEARLVAVGADEAVLAPEALREAA